MDINTNIIMLIGTCSGGRVGTKGREGTGDKGDGG